MKFLLDMPLSPKTALFLRDLGYEAIRVNEIGMAKSKDKEIFEYASEKNLVILSSDLDFGNILAYTQSNKPSVVIFRLQDPSPEHVNSLLSSNLQGINEDLMKGSIVIIEDFKIRVRKLPIIEQE